MKVKIKAVLEFESDLWKDFQGYEGATTPAEIAAVEKATLETDPEQLVTVLVDHIEHGEYEAAVTITPMDADAGAPTETRVVTICGSMRFFDDMLKVAEEETAAGRIVLAPFSVVAPEDQGGEHKAMLDDLHRRKIDLSSEIIVVTRGGYIGESTRGEIEYAEQTGKTVRYFEFGPMTSPF